MIEIKDLEVGFKSELTSEINQVLKKISFDVKKGECLAILGESGSGKSTLGKVICGLLKPSGGEYKFLGSNPYENKKNKKVLSKNMSIVFQDYNTSVNPRFTVYEIICESLNLLSKRSKINIDKKERVKELLNLIGLDESYMNRFSHQLSGGQLQRVCIARAIAVEPQVILFDEAISSLDSSTQVQIMDLLKSLKEKFNLTYLFITHDLVSVTYLCTKVMFLYDGNITQIIDVKDISKSNDEYAKKLLNTVLYI